VFTACVFFGSSAFAQPLRTWVSGTGNDADPCSRTAPCKSFSAALAATAAGGEISVLDPGGYGSVTITKPITISGVGTQAGILVSGATAVNISIAGPLAAPLTATVTLRNIQIVGAAGVGSPGVIGVLVTSPMATKVILDNVNIRGFGDSGVRAEGANKVSINGGVFSENGGIAIHAIDTSSINVANAQIVGNNIAVQADLGSTIRLSNNDVYDNKTGFACGTGGTLASAGNNRKAGNVGGAVATCNPTVAVTIQ